MTPEERHMAMIHLALTKAVRLYLGDRGQVLARYEDQIMAANIRAALRHLRETAG